MDLTPLIPGDRQQVESYGEGGFRVNGVRYEGSILVFPDRCELWAPKAFDEITLENLAPVLRQGSGAELLLIGCGSRLQLLPRALRQALRERGLSVEPMDTGAACRTYNVLMAEERLVAAALIAVD